MNTYLAYRWAQILIRYSPRRLAYWVGLRIADRFYRHDQAGRRNVIANLRHICKAQGVDASANSLAQMARKNFQNFGKYLVDFFKFSQLRLKDVQRLVSMEHLEYLEQARRLGKGIIFITAHLGSWELGGAVVSALGYPLNAVVQPERVGKINELFRKYRNLRGMRVIPLGHAARGVLEALRRNECVAMLADRDYTPHNEPIEVFGQPARLPSGPARIALKTGAPLVPIFLLRQPDETFLLRLHPPIIPAADASVLDIRRRIRDILEAEIARNPLQWFMFSDFWQLNNRSH